MHCFYSAPKGETPIGDNATSNWFLKITTELLNVKVTRSNCLNLEKKTELQEELTNVVTRKRKKPQNKSIDSPGKKYQPSLDLVSSGVLPSSSACSPPTQLLNATVTWFDSPEANIMFRTKAAEQNALEAIHNQIQLLCKANETFDGYLQLLEGAGDKEELSELLSVFQKYNIRTKITILILALRSASENMPRKTWRQCCEEAISNAHTIGLTSVMNPQTVEVWYRKFRLSRQLTSGNLPGKHNLPPFLQENKDISIKIQQYARENLQQLSVELIMEYMHETILPQMICQLTGAVPGDEQYDNDKKELLGQYGLKLLSISTVYRWMKALGFKYEVRKKGFYVDGHEKAATLEYRKKFINRYMCCERRAHRWIQLTLNESKELEEKKLIPRNSGYRYTNGDGVNMVEYHVDSLGLFQERMDRLEFGGNLSVRKKAGEKPLIIFGHDECIYKQYLLTKKAWTLPSGEKQLVPKDEGQGIMISALQSREFGFGLPLTEEQLKVVNDARVGEHYKDAEAAKKYKGGTLKGKLHTSPFIVEFEYGASNEGYWNYERMVLQLEDCIDVVKILWPQYDYLFLFDHSCGHDKQRADGLNAENMLRGYGGKQALLRDTTIEQEEGCLGPKIGRTLNVGDVQSFIFKPTDEGPFYLNAQEREMKRQDVLLEGTKKRKLTKKELEKQLTDSGIEARGTAKKLQQLCKDRGLPIEAEERKIVEGWVGKPKGMLQVLWERGFINEGNLQQYTVDGKKDAYGVLIPNTSLKLMVSNLQDFEEEESLLQSMGRLMGVTIDRTPKCHCEFAGEGIEYSWGCSKNEYRGKPINVKRKKENFRDTVRQCLSRDVLTTERVRKFSARARAYMLAYLALDSNFEAATTPVNTTDIPVSAVIKIEKMVKQFKTHRCALDFDGGFIKSTVLRT